MKTSAIFWGVILVVVGGVFLTATFSGVPIGTIGKFIFPTILVVLGIWVLLSFFFFRPKPLETESVTIPLEDAKSAVIKLNHGAGKVDISACETKNTLLEGTFVGGITQNVSTVQGEKQVELNVASNIHWTNWFASSGNSQGLRWNLTLAPKIPLQIIFKSGADEARLDLTNLNVTDLKVETGASSTNILLPEQAGFTRVKVSSGVASVKVSVPAKVAARIKIHGGLASKNVDTNRFPLNGSVYETPGYESAKNKAEISVDTGVGSFSII